MEEIKHAYNILGGKSEGNTWAWMVEYIRVDLKEIVREGVDWIHAAQNRDQRRALVNTVMNEPSDSIKGWVIS
jgi:hypothetical protein